MSKNGRKYSNYKTCLFDFRIYLSRRSLETGYLLSSEILGRVEISVFCLGAVCLPSLGMIFVVTLGNDFLSRLVINFCLVLCLWPNRH